MLVWTFSLRWFEYHSISVQVDSLKPTVSKVRLPETRFTWMVPCKGTFNHSLRHARKDLLSKRSEAHAGSNWSIPIIISICFVGFDKAIIRFPGFPLLDCWHARHLQKPQCMMQAWEKNTEPHSQSRALGLQKMEPRCLEQQKCLRCRAEKNRRCRGVSKHLRFPQPKSQFFSVK